MKIKKAVYHQTQTDSPRNSNRNRSSSNQFSKYTNSQQQNEQLQKLLLHKTKQLIKKNKQNQKQSRVHAANLLTKILKRNVNKSPDQQQNNSLYRSQILSPQQVIQRQRKNKQNIKKNHSQIIQSLQKKKNKIILENIRNQQKKHSSLLDRKIIQDINQLHQYQKNQLQEIDQGKTYTISNKSHSIDVTTIKQRIQQYLARQQYKRMQYKNAIFINKNPRLVTQIKHSNPYSSPKPHSNSTDKVRQQIGLVNIKKSNEKIFSSFSSLIRKKQSKYTLEMMKRKLNFSVINKSNRDNSQQDNEKISTLIKKRKDHSGQKQLIIEGTQDQLKFKTQQQEQQLIQNKIMYCFQKNPQILKQIQKQIKYGDSPTLQRFTNQVILRNNFNNFAKMSHSNSPPNQLNLNSHKSEQNLNINQENKLLEKLNQIPIKQLNVKNNQRFLYTKQYLYTFYYYPPELIQRQKEQLAEEQKNKNGLQNTGKYKDWKKITETQKRLKNLLKHELDPIDPLQYYKNSFQNKRSPYSFNSYTPSKNPLVSHSPSYKYHFQNKKSISKMLEDYHNQASLQENKKNRYLTTSINQSLQQKIIFVNKKKKQNLKQKKLSNLLYKIQKRNNQIEKMGQIQVIDSLNLDQNSPKLIKKKISQTLNKKRRLGDGKDQQLIVTLYNKNKYSQKWNQKYYNFKNGSLQKKSLQKNKNKKNSQWNYFQPWKAPSKNQGYQQELSLIKQ